jgi:hypothetical protein
MTYEKNGKLYADEACLVELRGKNINMQELTEKLRAMSGSPTAQDALQVIERFRRMLLPVFMGVSETAMLDEPIADERILFHFMGSGASDQTYMAEFRSLMGDERLSLVDGDVVQG